MLKNMIMKLLRIIYKYLRIRSLAICLNFSYIEYKEFSNIEER